MRTLTITILLIVVVGCEGKEEEHKQQAKEATEDVQQVMQEAVADAFPGAKVAVDRAKVKSTWMKQHNMTMDQVNEMEAIYVHRRPANDATEFWDVLIQMTPDQFKQKYPPLTDKEWFKAEFVDMWGWREFERPISYSSKQQPYELTLKIWIVTIPKKPIKTVRGNLTILDKHGEKLWESVIEETPDVSFVHRTGYWLKIEYDDSNAKHRTLRFAEREDFGLTFIPFSVVYADGTEQSFQ